MSAAEISADDLYNELDRVYSSLSELLKQCTKSQVVNRFIIDKFKSIIYANLILNFFDNLNQKVIKENDLPRGKISNINRKYKLLRKHARKALSQSSKSKKIDEECYSRFKANLLKSFPEFIRIIHKIEWAIDINKAGKYIQKKEEEIDKLGKAKTDINAKLFTVLFEDYIKKGKNVPAERRKLIKLFVEKVSQSYVRTIVKNAIGILNDEREQRIEFEKRLYWRWKEPLDLLEIFYRMCKSEKG